MPSKKATPPKKAAKPAAKPVAKKAEEKKAVVKKTAAKKPAAEAKKPVAKPAPKKVAAKPAVKKPVAKKVAAKPAPKKPVAKPVQKKAVAKPEPKKPVVKPAAKPIAKKEPIAKPVVKAPATPISSLIVPGVKFIKVPFFADIEKEEKGKRKNVFIQRPPDKPTASSRPKVGNAQDTKTLVEMLSQQLEFENKMFFEGCEGQICVKCNNANVDPKYYVDKSLGYCVECATRLGLGQSKEGVFSDAQMELMRRSMEKTIENASDIDEDDIESALGDMDSLELEEALLAVEEEMG